MTYILIDDDELIHELWKLAAKEASVSLKCFYSIDEFLAKASEYDRGWQIYIDSNLKDARGEEEAIKVKEAGFSHIYIATGYDPGAISAPEFVQGVVGKRPPF